MYVICVFMSPHTDLYTHAWLPTYMYIYIHTISTYDSRNNFVSAEQKANKLSSFISTTLPVLEASYERVS